MLLYIYSLYGQGPFLTKLYIKGCHFSQNYVQKRVFVQYITCTDKGLGNQSAVLTY